MKRNIAKTGLFSTALILIFLITSLPLASAYSLTYDANGNLITGDGKFRVYDGFNHLVQVRNGSDSSGLIMENYTWHPTEDRILAKSVYETNGSWKEDVLYISKEYVVIDNASGSFDYKYYYQNGQLVAQLNPDGTKLFMHNDHLGSVSLVTNESGAVVEETFYEPFGEILSGGETSRYDYTGKEYDSVVGDYDFNARKLGLNPPGFTTPDLNIQNVYEPKDLNHYTYVRNNPYVAIDPDGKFVVYIGGNIMGGAIAGGALAKGIAISYSFSDGLQIGRYTRISAGGVSPTASASGEVGFAPLLKNLNEFSGITKDIGGDVGLASFSVGGGLSAPYNEEEDKLKIKKGAFDVTASFTDINPQIIPGSGYIMQSTTTISSLYPRGLNIGSTGSVRTSGQIAERQIKEAEKKGGVGGWTPTSGGGAIFKTITPIKRTPGKGVCLSCG